MISLLHLERPSEFMPFEIGLDVGHDDRVGAPQPFERRVDGARPERGPFVMAPEPEQEVVAAAHDVVDERSMFLGRWVSDAMTLDEFGEARHDVGCAVQHGLIGPKAKVGQKDFARATPGGQPWAMAIAIVDAPVPPGPVTATRWPGA
jgi:hypothetical protein